LNGGKVGHGRSSILQQPVAKSAYHAVTFDKQHCRG
jgi:hypothetical protein